MGEGEGDSTDPQGICSWMNPSHPPTAGTDPSFSYAGVNLAGSLQLAFDLQGAVKADGDRSETASLQLAMKMHALPYFQRLSKVASIWQESHVKAVGIRLLRSDMAITQALLPLGASPHIVIPALLFCSPPSDCCLSPGTARHCGSRRWHRHFAGNPARYFLMLRPAPKSSLTDVWRKTGLQPPPCKKTPTVTSTPGAC